MPFQNIFKMKKFKTQKMTIKKNFEWYSMNKEYICEILILEPTYCKMQIYSKAHSNNVQIS